MKITDIGRNIMQSDFTAKPGTDTKIDRIQTSQMDDSVFEKVMVTNKFEDTMMYADRIDYNNGASIVDVFDRDNRQSLELQFGKGGELTIRNLGVHSYQDKDEKGFNKTIIVKPTLICNDILREDELELVEQIQAKVGSLEQISAVSIQRQPAEIPYQPDKVSINVTCGPNHLSKIMSLVIENGKISETNGYSHFNVDTP
jgi:hypothetical protein